MATGEHENTRGRDAQDGHNGRGILYSEASEKDAEAFKAALAEHQEEHGPDFRGMVFPEHANFEGSMFESAPVVFRDATFRNGATFSGAMIAFGADFENATFNGEADFSNVVFDSEHSEAASFKNATFRDEANFGSAIFGGASIFEHATFEGETSFPRRTPKRHLTAPHLRALATSSMPCSRKRRPLRIPRSRLLSI